MPAKSNYRTKNCGKWPASDTGSFISNSAKIIAEHTPPAYRFSMSGWREKVKNLGNF
jgi:hypothetical protein